MFFEIIFKNFWIKKIQMKRAANGVPKITNFFKKRAIENKDGRPIYQNLNEQNGAREDQG